MEYNATKYYKGTKEMNSASDLLSDIYQACRNKWTSWGSKFEYKAELNDILDGIFKVSSDSTAICNTIEMGRNNISTLDSKFAADYFEISNMDFQEMSLSEQEANGYLINYTNKELARELDRHTKKAHSVEIGDKALNASFMLNKEGYSSLSEEEKIKEMQYFREEVLEYKNMEWYEKAGVNTVAFIGGTVEGVVGVGEEVVDGGYMLIGGGISYLQEASGNSAAATATRVSVTNFVNNDFSGNMYDSFANWTGLNSYAMNGTCRSAGNVTGQALGEVGLQFLPGGTYVMVAAHGLKGAGKSAESAFKKGKDFNSVYLYSLGNGVIEASASFLLYGKTKEATKVLDIVNNAKINPLGKLAFNNKYGKVLTKSVIAGTKEYTKSGTTFFIDDDYTLSTFAKEGSINAAIAVGTQFFNEIIVSPNVNKVTKKTDISTRDAKVKKVSDIKKQNESYINTKHQQILRSAEMNAKDSIDLSNEFILPKANTNSFEMKLTNDISRLTNIIEQCDKIIEKNNLNMFEKLVNNEYVNKVAKKVSSSNIKTLFK